MRIRTIFILAMAAGAAGAASAWSKSTFVVAFCFVFWAAVVGGVLLLARPRHRIEPTDQPDLVKDPWVDDLGVRRFPQDVLDIENHPKPGAHGRL